MSPLEEQLRGAYHEAAQAVRPETVAELHLPSASRARRFGRRPYLRRLSRGTGTRRLAPLAAAAAVMAIIAVAAVLAAAQGGPLRSGVPGRSQADAPGTIPAIPAPPFFIGEVEGSGGSSQLAAFNARTGRIVDLITAPKGLYFEGAAATAQSRSFVVAESRQRGACYTLFDRVRLTADGKFADISPLPLPRVHGAFLAPALTSSANGQVIAYSANNCNGGHGWVSVIHLASRQTRTWSLNSEGVTSLSLSADGGQLMFNATTVLGGNGAIYDLRTAAPAGPVARRARAVLTGSDADILGSVALLGDGKTFLACKVIRHEGGTLARYDSATGQQTGVIHRWRDVDVFPCAISVTPSGRYVLVTDITAHGIGTRIDLATGGSRPVPGGGRGGEDLPVGVAW